MLLLVNFRGYGVQKGVSCGGGTLCKEEESQLFIGAYVYRILLKLGGY